VYVSSKARGSRRATEGEEGKKRRKKGPNFRADDASAQRLWHRRSTAYFGLREGEEGKGGEGEGREGLSSGDRHINLSGGGGEGGEGTFHLALPSSLFLYAAVDYKDGRGGGKGEGREGPTFSKPSLYI